MEAREQEVESRRVAAREGEELRGVMGGCRSTSRHDRVHSGLSSDAEAILPQANGLPIVSSGKLST
jgi:hypothetical protein